MTFESCGLTKAKSSQYYVDAKGRRGRCVRMLHTGELLKRGMSKFKTWHTRSFKLNIHLVAEVGELEYYSGSKHKGTIVFSHETFVSPMRDKNGRPFCLTLTSKAFDKTLIASARDDADRARWVARIHDVIKMLQSLAVNSAKPAFKSISSMSGRVTFFARDMLATNLCGVVKKEAGLREKDQTKVERVSVRVDGQCSLHSHYGRQFHAFRKQCGLTDSEFLACLSDGDWIPLSDDLVFQSNRASYKYASRDRRVLVVVLRGEEYRALHRMLQNYFQYMGRHWARTFLPKIFGMFELRSDDEDTKQFIICTSNPAKTDLEIHRRYECTHFFFDPLGEEQSDEDFIDVGACRSEVVRQLRLDTDFLARCGVVDYRLLLWVHASDHPLGANPKLEMRLRRRCWDESANDRCLYHDGFLSTNRDGTFRVTYLSLWDVLSACATVSKRSSSTRLSLRTSSSKTELAATASQADTYKGDFMRMALQEVFPPCEVPLFLASRDERRFLLRCLKHQRQLAVHMRANDLMLPASACQARAVHNPFEDTRTDGRLGRHATQTSTELARILGQDPTGGH